MKISVNDQELFTISDTKEKVIKNDIPQDNFYEDMKRRLKYILMYKYEQCFDRLKKEWEPKLKANGVSSIPLDEEKFAELVFSQPEYLDRSTRDAIAASADMGTPDDATKN